MEKIAVTRSDLVSAIKDFNATGLTKKIKTKKFEDSYELLIHFLETIEALPNDADVEEQVPQSVVKYYNRMARRIEEASLKAIIDSVENGEPEESSDAKGAEKEITDFLVGKNKQETVSKLSKITDLMEGYIEGEKTDLFGLRLGSKDHNIARRLVAGKSEGFMIKKDICTRTELKALIKKIKDKNPNVTVTKFFKNDKFFYEFFME